MSQAIDTNIPRDTFAKTHLHSHLFQYYMSLNIEEKHMMINVIKSPPLIKVLNAYYREILVNTADITETDPQKLFIEYSIMRCNLLLIQDLLGFFGMVEKDLKEVYPGLDDKPETIEKKAGDDE